MHRHTVGLEVFSPWALVNLVHFEGITLTEIPYMGYGLVATTERNEDASLLMTVPKDLILSLENVWILAKADKHLREVLEAVGDYARTARGAILIFLLLQFTHTAGSESGHVGISNQFTQYVQMLPSEINIPTFWSEHERAALAGTSLDVALAAKLNSLNREFAEFRNATLPISWCKKYWWDEGIGCLTIEDWKLVDALYRSRALDLPGTGHAMVPCIDMANHSSGEKTNALYDTDADGNGVLVLRDGKSLKPGEEVTITYGDEKGACEMLFSYGFLEADMTSARELFLDLDIEDDDPLKLAKKSLSGSAPGFRLFSRHDSIMWESAFVWLLCVNEEDGLQFDLLQTNHGSRELKVSWRGHEMSDLSRIEPFLQEDPRWMLYQLRATVVLRDRVDRQLCALNASNGSFKTVDEVTEQARVKIRYATKLRDLEESLMLQAYQELEDKITNELVPSDVVQHYLGCATQETQSRAEDDFS